MHKPVDHPTRVRFDEPYSLRQQPTRGESTKGTKDALAKAVARIADLQEALYAEGSRALLCIFQGIDGSGKDSTIEKVFSGVNPAGVAVESFKQPSQEDLAHDFLWRHVAKLPRRGTIGVWNRSWYEEVLVVRVHPEHLRAARLPGPDEDHAVWENRHQSIRDYERHLSRNGTVILKFFLNLSKDEQRRRFLARLDDPEKQWKFNPGDLAERERWDSYRKAFEDMLHETSRAWAPWYAIPADDKDEMRLMVATIIADTLASMAPVYPGPPPEVAGDLAGWRKRLEDA